MKNKIKRRSFLTLSSSAIATLSASSFVGINPLLSLAAPEKKGEKFFVLIRTFGGMDCTLGLDPKIHQDTDQEDIFIEYRPDQIIQAGNLQLGPSAEILKNHASDIAIINGLYMGNDLGHTHQYVASGDGSLRSATIASELTAIHKNKSAFGLVFDTKSYTGVRSIMTTQLDQIESLSSNSDLSLLNAVLDCSDDEACEYLESQKAYREARKVAKDFQSKFELVNRTLSVTSSTFAQLGAAFLSHGSYFAELGITSNNLDTHADHQGTHLNNQKTVWDQVNELFKLFKALPYGNGSLFDATTFMVISEFSRTPYLNSSLGKDHNTMTNSVLLAGRGIQGNQVIGESIVHSRKVRKDSKAIHTGLPMDFKTGQIVRKYREGIDLVTPKHLIRTIAKLYGDPKGFSAVSMSTPVIPGVLKS